jgi:hypothetical protein
LGWENCARNANNSHGHEQTFVIYLWEIADIEAGLFDGHDPFTARRSFDNGVHRRDPGLPGRDPLHAVASRLTHLRTKAAARH